MARPLPATPEVHAKWRFYAESLIEQAITLLDEIDGDPDLENGGNCEPSLAGAHLTWRTIQRNVSLRLCPRCCTATPVPGRMRQVCELEPPISEPTRSRARLCANHM